MAERLQKVLASAGLGSRRACEELILDGRVRVNGKRVVELPVLIDPSADKVQVDGRRIRTEPKVYYLLNKPKGVLCTQSDPDGRRRAADLLTGVRERVYPVGRLDADSQGLLLMTNDGELAAGLTHPRYGVPKTYRARVRGKVEADQLAKLRRGIWLSEGKTRSARVTVAYTSRTHSILEITLREGRNRQVRRMLARMDHAVRDLTRIRMGRLSLYGLGVGQYRPLKPSEVTYLKGLVTRSADGAPADAPPSRKPKRAVKRAARPKAATSGRRAGPKAAQARERAARKTKSSRRTRR